MHRLRLGGGEMDRAMQPMPSLGNNCGASPADHR